MTNLKYYRFYVRAFLRKDRLEYKRFLFHRLTSGLSYDASRPY